MFNDFKTLLYGKNYFSLLMHAKPSFAHRLQQRKQPLHVSGEPPRVLHAFVKKNMVQYMRPYGRFAHNSCETPFWPLLLKHTRKKHLNYGMLQYILRCKQYWSKP